MFRNKFVTVAIGLMSTGVMIAGASTAFAATQHTVQANVPKPTVCPGNSGTIPQGSWLANKPCGYIVGTALAGSSFDNQENSPNDFHYGRGRTGGGANFCAWINPGSLDSGAGTPVADSCSAEIKSAISQRRSFGTDFDNDAHEGDGTPTIPIDASACTGYYNYFSDSTYSTGTLHDPVDHPLSTTGAYRYSSNNHEVAMIRNGVSGDDVVWMFVARSCIEGQLAGHTLWTTND